MKMKRLLSIFLLISLLMGMLPGIGHVHAAEAASQDFAVFQKVLSDESLSILAPGVCTFDSVSSDIAVIDSHDSHSYEGGVCTVCGDSVLGTDWLEPVLAQGDYTVAVIPDPQILVESYPESYYRLTDWIASQKEALNIQAVLHMGDMVNANTDAQWQITRQGMDQIDASGIAWMPMRGNHDDSTMFNSYFDYATYGSGQSWFGGAYTEGTLDHTYWFFTVGDRTYLVLSLGWAPTWDVLDWAEALIRTNADKNVIITCHAYMNQNDYLLEDGDDGCVNSYFNTLYPEGVDIWDQLGKYANVVLAMGGHVSSNNLSIYQDTNGAGKLVSSILADSQGMDRMKPAAMVMLMTFHSDSDTVDINWYSTEYDALYRDINQFSISVPHVHNHKYIESLVPPTCEEPGYTAHTCSCGNSYQTNFTDAAGHAETVTPAVAPTCTEAGLTEGLYCSACGEVLEAQQTVAALGHTEVTDPAVAPTCMEAGLTEGKHCSACGEILESQQTVAALGHSYDAVVTAPTCTQQGCTTHTCTRCQDSYADAYQDALGHQWDSGVVTLEPTEAAEGEKLFTCTVCSETKKEIIPELEHVHSYTAVVTAPTCTEQGYTTHSCRCGDSYVDTDTDALGHAEVIDAAVAPTCSSTGLTEGKHCSRCGEVLIQQEVVAALGHSYAATLTLPSCTKGGYTTYLCACGDTYVADLTEALGHTEVTDPAVAPTCTATGLTEGKHCSRCGEVLIQQEAVAALGHTEVTDAAVAPTCTAAGLTEGKHCSRCGEVLVKQEVVAALGHSHDAVVTAPTCTQKGYTTHTCHCGDSYVDTDTDVLGHAEVIDAAVAPSCTATGLTEGKHCSRCEEILVPQKTVAALGHQWDSGIVTLEPTEETTGSRLYTCTVCSETKTELIPELEHVHSYDAVITAPTCTDRGYTTHTCRCSDSYVDTYVAALGHAEVIDAAVAPSCTATGLTEGKHCSRCEEILIPQETVAALGHSYTSVVTAPTCTEKGYTTHTCSCGESYVDTYVPATGHSWDDGTVTTEPSETAEGERTYTCIHCGSTRVESIPKLEHVHVFNPTLTAPTCTQEGYTTFLCSCGSSYVTQKKDPLGHDWENWELTRKPNYLEYGEQTHTCARCGESETEPVNNNPFEDVGDGSRFKTAILWAYYTGVTRGTDATHFAPTNIVNRQQFVMFLWQAAGSPEPEAGENPFTDVSPNNRFYKAILWASQNGITTGTGDGTTFSPKDNCTRGQVVMFLYRYAGKPEIEKEVENPFTDVSVNNNFYKAILWAYSNNITSGKTATTFEIRSDCQRQHVVTFLYRYLEEQTALSSIYGIWLIKSLPEHHIYQFNSDRTCTIDGTQGTWQARPVTDPYLKELEEQEDAVILDLYVVVDGTEQTITVGIKRTGEVQFLIYGSDGRLFMNEKIDS